MPLDDYRGFPRMHKVDMSGPSPLFCPFNTVARYEPGPFDTMRQIPESLFDPFDESPVVYESSLGWMEP